MVTYYPELAQRVRSQRDLQPDLYGNFDFDQQPDRLATEPDVESALPAWIADRAPILQDDRVVELMSTATLLGDVVADPYAALMTTHSVTHLIDMLKRACRKGIEAVPEAPPSSCRSFAAMEATPAWIDFDLVLRRRSARAHSSGAAGALHHARSLRRDLHQHLRRAADGPDRALSGKRPPGEVNETASFFARHHPARRAGPIRPRIRSSRHGPVDALDGRVSTP